MKIRAECVPCLLGRTLYETYLIDSSKDLKVMEEACRIISTYDLNDTCSAVIATEVHGATYKILGTEDPYKSLKNRCNQIALSLLPKAEKLIETSEDRLKNNCGEIVFDKLLCKEIKKFDVHLTLVVRGEPILTDATLEDAHEFGLDKIVDRVLTTGCFAVGVDFENMPKDLLNALESADLIISKGMANYETFSETDYRPIAHFLRTKCVPVAEDMGLKTNINVVKIYE
jgi:uncharacterized protein with ATP-grasp and redox domains